MARKKNVENNNAFVAEDIAKEKEVTVEKAITAGESVCGNKGDLKCEADALVGCLNFPNNIVFNVPDDGKDNSLTHRVEFYGNATALVGKKQGVLPIGAYGLTPNISRKDWEWIKENHKDNQLIKNGLLFATEPDKARDEAAKHGDKRHGYEPLDMESHKATV